MGHYGSLDFKTIPLLQIAAESFQTFFLNFLPNGPHKTTFGIFEILKIKILTIFSSAWLCQQSSWNHNLSVVRRPSVRRSFVRPCCNYLWTQCTDFFQILVVSSPGLYARTFFQCLKNFFFDFFTNIFSLTWDPMGVEISKRYYPYKSQPKVSKLFLNFLTNGPHKSMFGIFENWNFNEFYSFSL